MNISYNKIDLSQIRIAILTEDDPIQCLEIWRHTIPVLSACNAKIIGLLLCKPRFAHLAAEDVRPWYQTVFGKKTVRSFDLYIRAAMQQTQSIKRKSGITNFVTLGHHHKITTKNCAGPNDPAFIHWLQQNEIDILILNCGQIVHEPTLAAVQIGIVNLHDSLLPAHGGVFAYLYTLLADDPPGLTVYQLDRGIDTGPLLAQRSLPDPQYRSLIGFQHLMIEHYPSLIATGIAALSKRQFLAPRTDLRPSYHSLPTETDYRKFQDKGGCFICPQDIRFLRQLRF